MSERPIAERHSWTDCGKQYIAEASEGGRIAVPLPSEEEAPAMLPDLVEELHRKDGVSACVRELLRVVAERDEARARLALPTSEVELIAQRWEGCAEDAEERAAAIAAELVRVAKERDSLEQDVLVEIDNRDRAYASIDAIADQLGVEEEWSNFHDRGECAVEAAAALQAERDRAVKAAAEAGIILEALRLAVIDELAPDIVRAIEPALKLIHAVIGAPDAAEEE